ncbi:hypothetical protein Dimus_038933 [Dionaea muscipula]
MDARGNQHPENQHMDDPPTGGGNGAEQEGRAVADMLPLQQPADNEPVTRAEFQQLKKLIIDGMNQILSTRYPGVPVTMSPHPALGEATRVESSTGQQGHYRQRRSKWHRNATQKVANEPTRMPRARPSSPSDPVDSMSNTLSEEGDDVNSYQTRRGKCRRLTSHHRGEESRSRVSTSRDHRPRQKGMSRRTIQPFTRNVLEDYCPNHVRLPSLDSYDGTEDPEDHLNHYEIRMSLQNFSDGMMCRAFPSTFKGAARRWFHRLPSNSISNFEEFGEKFIAQFASSSVFTKSVPNLFDMKQEADESLREFMSRFSKAYIEIPGVGKDVATAAIMTGLRPGPFRDDLSMRMPKTFDKLLQRAKRYMALEDLNDSSRGEASYELNARFSQTHETASEDSSSAI